MAGVKLDLTGRLLSFYAVPPQVDPVQGPTTNLQSHSTSPNFETLFSAAGLNKANFRPSESKWAPLYQSDTRVAWEGVYPEQPSIPIRIEAASRLDKPVYFEIVNPWSRPERQEPSSLPWQLSAVISLLIITFILVLIGSVLLAIKNLRLGRSDRKGALRLALFVFTSTVVARLFAAHHVPSLDEFGVFLNGLQDAVFAGGFFWIVYVALEPLVRKRWPGRIISWTRLLGGDFRDPLIGRDVLIGGLLGLVIALWQLTLFLAREWLGDSTLKPALEPANLRLGMAYFPQSVVEQFSTPLLNSFQLLFLVLLLSMIVRRDWLGFIVGWLVFAAALAFLGGGEIVNWLSASVTAGIISFVLFRYGLLAVISCLVFLHFYLFFPVTTNLTSWYATGGVIDLLLMLALAFAAFYTSLGGQSPFSGKLLKE
jgi:serine/threonine-protein kinase